MREYLEKHYEEKSGMEAVKLAIKALTETVEAGSKNIEVTPSHPPPHPQCNPRPPTLTPLLTQVNNPHAGLSCGQHILS